jgi:limonene 1,2-monooxygenase
MMGLDQVQQRRKMNESLDAIMALFEAKEPVNMETDWFTLRDARLQLKSFSRPHLPVAVAAVLTPSGPTAAGRHGVGVLSVGGFDSEGFARTWQWAEESAAQSGKQVDRTDWRVVAPIHIAETREQAIADVREGFLRRAYFGDEGQARPAPDEAKAKTQPRGRGQIVAAAIGLMGDSIEDAMERGSVIVGSPDDACEAIETIQQRTGGFGTLLGLAHEWASTERTRHSYELWARYVAPQFQGQADGPRGSASWVMTNGRTINSAQGEAFKTAFADAGKALPDAVRAGLGE